VLLGKMQNMLYWIRKSLLNLLEKKSLNINYFVFILKSKSKIVAYIKNLVLL